MLLISVIAAIGIVIFAKASMPDVKNYGVEIKKYNPNGICDALAPGCGYCPGEVVDNKCYVQDKEKANLYNSD